MNLFITEVLNLNLHRMLKKWAKAMNSLMRHVSIVYDTFLLYSRYIIAAAFRRVPDDGDLLLGGLSPQLHDSASLDVVYGWGNWRVYMDRRERDVCSIIIKDSNKQP